MQSVLTLDALVVHNHKLLLAAGIAEERRVDVQLAATPPRTPVLHLHRDVNLALVVERHVALARHLPVVASVGGEVEHDDVTVGTRDVEDVVEAAMRGAERWFCNATIYRCRIYGEHKVSTMRWGLRKDTLYMYTQWKT